MPTPTLTQRVNDLTELVREVSRKLDRVDESSTVDLEDVKRDVNELGVVVAVIVASKK